LPARRARHRFQPVVRPSAWPARCRLELTLLWQAVDWDRRAETASGDGRRKALAAGAGRVAGVPPSPL